MGVDYRDLTLRQITPGLAAFSILVGVITVFLSGGFPNDSLNYLNDSTEFDATEPPEHFGYPFAFKTTYRGVGPGSFSRDVRHIGWFLLDTGIITVCVFSAYYLYIRFERRRAPL